MITVGCSGFAVPATRYFKEYDFVEIAETFRAVPGPGTVRRWRREAPPGFRFAMLGPRPVGVEGFQEGETADQALQMLRGIGEQLSAKLIVFTAPADFQPTTKNRAALKLFLERLGKEYETVVFDPGSGWESTASEELAIETGAIAARDPLTRGLSSQPTAYYRLPGPAGHKSRYEDPAIEKLAELAKSADHESVHYVFTNVDMFADGKRLKKAMDL